MLGGGVECEGERWCVSNGSCLGGGGCRHAWCFKPVVWIQE